ncbi:MAG: hypothetical protein KDK05_03835 [Candidatus Competibacteraceae bacterium]|nr:hypothetical protein [Candidatus Competibacteraceae bacterium]
MTNSIYEHVKHKSTVGERHAVEHDDYTVINRWDSSAFTPILRVFNYGDDWLISDGPPYWTNRLPGCLWYCSGGKDQAIGIALAGKYLELPHHAECTCSWCNPLDSED